MSSEYQETYKEDMQPVGNQPGPEGVPANELPAEIRKTGNGKSISWIWNIAAVIVVLDILRRQAWNDLIRLIFIIVIMFGLLRIAFYFIEEGNQGIQGYIRLLAKAIPAFFILFFISLILNVYDVTKPLARGLALVGICGVLFSFTSLMQYKRFLKPMTTTSTKLEDKIKAELNVHDVKNYSPSFPKPLNWIGGFMTPMLPFFTVVNRNWEKNLSKEAFIHEHVHIHLFLYEGWSIILIFAAFFLPIIGKLAGLNGSLSIIFIILGFAGLLTYHEKITFERTKSLAAKYNVETRGWDSQIARKYIVVYFIWFSTALIVFNLAKLFLHFLFGVKL